jgi:alpha-methylacyl-CoA racemase
MLADMGADIIRIDKKGEPRIAFIQKKFDVLHRNIRSVTIDFKKKEGIEAALKLIDKAEAIIEGFRPGVMEKLGLGPDICLKRNPKLIFGRMTGWGQEGPLAQAAGHDINYIAITGALHAIGKAGEKPVVPLNIVGDFGGGSLFLAFGIMCGVYEARQSGKGQVVDAAVVDGTSALMGAFYGLKAAGIWSDNRGTNILDGGAQFYDTYETSDGKYISLGSLEPQFYKLLLELAEIDDPVFKNQLDIFKWPEMKEKLAVIIKSKTRDEWCEIMEGTDVCFAPVLSFDEAINHPHNVEREVFIDVDGVMQPAPAPRFSRTKPEVRWGAPDPGDHNDSAFSDWGFSADEVNMLNKEDVI